jgi:peptidoglycan/LPS O-acetylase OafA/YrhL
MLPGKVSSSAQRSHDVRDLSLGRDTAAALTVNVSPENLQISSHIPQLDGLRGIAIVAVMLVHSADRLSNLRAQSLFRYGWVGVDLFFVLSGFLITRILIRARGSDRFFLNFYARRALRVWPLYYLVLIFTFLAIPPLLQHYGLQATQISDGRGVAAYALFVQNLWHTFLPLNPALGVTWSLAIEEQFYIVWPMLVFCLSNRTLRWMLAGILVASPLLRAAAFHFGVPGIVVYTHTLTRLDGIAMGCLLALWIHSHSITRNRLARSSFVGLVGGGTLAALFIPAYVTEPANPVAFTALAISFGGLVGLALATSPVKGVFGRALASQWLGYAGKVSYCVYLIHLPIFLLVGRILKHSLGALQGTVVGDCVFVVSTFGITFGLATASWYLFEEPILRLKSKFGLEADIRRPRLIVPYRAMNASAATKVTE